MPVLLLAAGCLLLTGCGGKKKAESPERPAVSETVSAVAGSAVTSSEASAASAATSSGTAAGSAVTSSEASAASAATSSGTAAGSAVTSSGTAAASAAAPDGAAAGQDAVSRGEGTEPASASEADAGQDGALPESASEEALSSGLLSFSLGGTINSAEDMADPATSGAESSAAAGGAILPGIGKLSISPLEKNELSQYIGMSFDALEKKFEGIESEVSFGVRSYSLGEAVDGRDRQVGMTGSESGGLITKINLYAGEAYKIAGIRSGMSLEAADKAAKAAGFDNKEESGAFAQKEEPDNGLTVYQAPDGLTVTVYSSDGATVDTVTCENR